MGGGSGGGGGARRGAMPVRCCGSPRPVRETGTTGEVSGSVRVRVHGSGVVTSKEKRDDRA